METIMKQTKKVSKASYSYLLQHPKELNKYRGQWLALMDDKIIAHGKNFAEVIEQAKKITPNPVMHQVYEEDIVVYLFRQSQGRHFVAPTAPLRLVEFY
jgi:hypothetical protein